MTLLKNYITIYFLFFSCFCYCQEKPNNKTQKTRIDNYINKLMKADDIPGIALAIVKNGKVIHKKNYGLANIVHKVPVSDSTLFRVYSTSKLMTAVAIFQLIEEGKLSLNNKISEFIDNTPKEWSTIEIKHLLTHSSGLPDYKNLKNQIELSDESLIKEMSSKPLNFIEGDHYSYNQTNFWFLQLIIEKITKEKFQNFIKKNQFKQNNKKVIYASNSLLAIPNRVPKYQFNKKFNMYELSSFKAGKRSLAGNGLNINLESLINWNKKLDNNELIKLETKTQMLTPYEYKNPNNLFSYSWGVFGPEDKRYYGFAGGGVCALMKFIDKNVSIIFLSNGFKTRPVISSVISYISGLVDDSLVRKERMLNEEVRLSFALNNFEQAIKNYKKIKAENININFERSFNNISSHYISNNLIDKAIKILKLYISEYPKSTNAHNFLGEAYFIKKQYNLSKKNYSKSIDLNPNNKKAKKMLKEIGLKN